MIDSKASAEAGPRGLTRAARVAVASGGALLVVAAVVLWASQGASVFLESAFAAVIACF